ncbi:DoxX family protein [Flavobacterium sp. AS60]|uniref:DoxX family protein n=1 Tax=Flavobacterium anseongense TaxID=2910677 RepID=UPI001F2FF9F3|nr:DoxX family protein [Flavobacterium sp. AS60]MCF6130458.1 DoxX family protein [Flavobacterium sp. AS60]
MKKNLFISFQPINLSLGILLVRVIIGVLMAFYGYQKLINFETMAASDFWAKEVSFLGMTGKTPLALTIFAEFFCSLLLIVGLFTRLSLIPLLICMGYIIAFTAKFEVIYSGDNGIEVNNAFVYFVIYLGIYLTGPGNYSLDYKIANR